MGKTISIGAQSFEFIRENDCFFVDKTGFIKEWWENADAVTLITRPRRFGKTLNLDMMNCFFSKKFQGRGDLFQGLSIWEEERYRELQGSYPVIFLSFAGVKSNHFKGAKNGITRAVAEAYNAHRYLKGSEILSPSEQAGYDVFWEYVNDPSPDKIIDDQLVTSSLNRLALYLERYYGRKVFILLDEYDTPLQEAYVSGYWEELVEFIRSMFNSAFKTNPYMERGLMTGITRVSKESIFSDLNNLTVVTTTSEKYCTQFGFTEKEVYQALEAQGMAEETEAVKRWYDGFTFGSESDVYNPWSITNFMEERAYRPYWANSSSNGLVNLLVRQGNAQTKMIVEELMRGGFYEIGIDEEIVFNQLQKKPDAIWSLLLASGYLKVVEKHFSARTERFIYRLELTNREVVMMFEDMIRDWFGAEEAPYNNFIKALLLDDVEAMNEFMNEIALVTLSSFDIAKSAAKNDAPERFYHGLVLGLMVELSDRYEITSNRESGFGRYDIMMIPKENGQLDPMVIEFKVRKQKKEASLEETAEEALRQIEEKNYDAALIAKGTPKERIRHYGFAFEGKRVLIKRD